MTTEPGNFRSFFLSLTKGQQVQLAVLAGTTIGNIKSHWAHARRVPKGRDGINRLHEACVALGAEFTKQQLLDFFYADRAQQRAA